jgi:NTE family protein
MSAHSASPQGKASDADVVLVLAGGNALGSYLAGAYEQLHEQGVQPHWIVGASVGAVTGAIIAGNAPEERVNKLRTFWRDAMVHSFGTPPQSSILRQTYNGLHAALAGIAGRPGLFQHRFPGIWSALPWMPNDVALYDHSPLGKTLERVIDFDRLNGGDIRLSVGCVDLESGEEVFFDTARDRIGPEHLLASTAISPLFPPVEIGGRLLCDPGHANNLPLDYVFDMPTARDLVCIAVDLFGLTAPRPKSLDAVLERTNDLIFASPVRRSIRALTREFALRATLEPDGPAATLLHVVYQSPAHDLAVKSLDFSPSSIEERWAAGRADMHNGLAALRAQKKQPFAYVQQTTGALVPDTTLTNGA